jgi:hypothetical protein
LARSGGNGFPKPGAEAPFRLVDNSRRRAVSHPISSAIYKVLAGSDGRRAFGELLDAAGAGKPDKGPACAEVLELWSRRLVTLLPLSD